MANIVEQIKEELSNFDESIYITEPEGSESLRYIGEDTNGYPFNQKARIQQIDRYYNSEFESGKYDGEGQRKTFLNIVKFAADVAAKQTDLDVKDFTFIPDSDKVVDKVELCKKVFTNWTRENEYGHLLNELNKDFSKYGSCVSKRVGDKVERVPLRNLKNTQDAISLKDAIVSGGYVIQEHELTPHQMRQFSDWTVPNLTEGKKYKVYERHGLVDPEGYDVLDGDDYVYAVTFILGDSDQAISEDGKILFMEQMEIEDFPYDEAHWSKQDGRWLGIGEVENQIENQIARNLSTNLRRRSMLWGSKKIFQSADTDNIGKNLITEVADGEVLEVGVNGAIQPVNMSTQHGADYSQDDAVWQENSRQKSFIFEVNTGESLPSGTPFRLGVILSTASETHFNLKREYFGFFVKRMFYNQLIPIFKDTVRTKEQRVALARDANGIQRVKDAIVTKEANRRLMDKILDENLTRNLQTLSFNFEEEAEKVKAELDKQPYFFLTGKPGVFDDIKFDMTLTITGEEIDINRQIETLSTLVQVLPPEDPRRSDIIARIVQLTGMDSTPFIEKNGTITGSNQNLNANQALTGTTESATGTVV